MTQPAPTLTRAARGLALCLVLAGSALAFALGVRAPDKLSKPNPKIALSPPELPKFEEHKCVACHQDVAREWAGTAHAIAWVDTHYVEQLAEKKRPETCWGCHAPKPLLQGDLAAKPVVREDGRHLGITCESCHLGAGDKVLGPRGTQTSAHASEAADVFTTGRSNALCVSCHRLNVGPVIGIAKDFEQAKLADAGFSCLGCHTAEVEMKFASKNGDEDPPVRKGRSHALQTPRDPVFLAAAFDVSVATKDGLSVLRVANRAGHRVPGLIGRVLEFEARALDAGGKELAKKTLKIDATAYLPVQGELSLSLGVQAASVKVVATHVEPRAAEPVVFLDTTLTAQR
jgi:hypothetical protein